MVNDQKGGLEMLNILISVLSSSLLTTRVVWNEAQRQPGAVVGAQTLEPESRSWTLALPPTVCLTADQLLDFNFLTYIMGLTVL